jgi:cytosine deaminase
MTGTAWPDAKCTHVANVNLPSRLSSAEVPGQPNDDGVVLTDLMVEDGRIAGFLPLGSSTSAPRYDADGGQIWPTFVDLHTHLDKGQTWPRTLKNADGTIETARANVRADAIKYWNIQDIEARFEFSLRSAYAHGTSSLRTHIDCFVPEQARMSFEVFRRLRDKWAGKIAMQAVSLVSTDLYDDPANAALIDLVADVEGKIGGITYRLDDNQDPTILDGRLDRLFGIAKARGLDVDLHVDENGQSSSRTLMQVAAAVIRNEFKGKVVCGHCCSLAVQSDEIIRQTISLVKEANLAIVSLPLTNQFLQGRIPSGTPRWRGITLLHELESAGVSVSIASDNCRDPCHQFGDMDLFDVFSMSLRLGQLDALDVWSRSITTTPASAMGIVSERSLVPGQIADFVLFKGRTFSELFARHQHDRVVIRAGKAIDTTPPDYRLLDHLMVPKSI